jgi:hypothetical protein
MHKSDALLMNLIAEPREGRGFAARRALGRQLAADLDYRVIVHAKTLDRNEKPFCTPFGVCFAFFAPALSIMVVGIGVKAHATAGFPTANERNCETPSTQAHSPVNWPAGFKKNRIGFNRAG